MQSPLTLSLVTSHIRSHQGCPTKGWGGTISTN